MRKLFLWLWDSAVEPVLERLHINGSEHTNLIHIWWIGVGELSKAPFHAAGDHSRGSTRNTISRVISSYIPIIRALLYARQMRISLFDPPHPLPDDRSRNQSPSSESNPGILLVTMPSTDGQAPLPGVTTEVNGILETLPMQAFRSKVLERPSSHQVLEELPLNKVMHFACHGVSDKHDPSNSRLLLNNSELSVRDISRVNTEAAQLVYLSACSTAENPSRKLANEVIHIASGFLLAGFSHVLATLWESQDACS